MSVVPLSLQPPSSSSDHDNTSVRVCLRVRPLLPYEQTVNAQKILSYPNPNQLSLVHHNTHHAFTFDYVFDDFSSQSQVYAAAIQPLVDSFLAGYNTTILAYGQTGSGKTHTMGTAASVDGMADDGSLGIIPRVIRDIFRCVHERETTHMHTVKVSFLEIYNEEIKDLLNTHSSGPQPYIREGPNNSIIVANSIEEVVATAQDTVSCLIRGSQCRVVGSTAMNATSSRSHAIFSIILSQRKLSTQPGDGAATTTSTASPADAVLAAGGDDEVIQSKFHFVDLAGSERLKRTGAVGDRMKEGININQGLLALGNCISALGGEKKAGHVPFRDSKITRMLQDSLGGNSKTLMIACISPADVNADETVNTLKYANRAKNIKNKPIINRDPNSAKIEALRLRMGVLESAITHFRAGNASEAEEALRSVEEVVASGGVGGAGQAGGRGSIDGGSAGGAAGAGASAEELSLLRDQNLVLEAELKRLSDRMRGLRDEMNTMGDKLVAAETDKDMLRLKLEKARSGDVKDGTPDGDDAEVSVLAENRRTMQRMSKKIAHQKRQLDSALKLINSYAIDGLPLLPTDAATPNGGGGSARKKRRKNRRRTNPTAEGGDSGGLQQRVDEEAVEDESDVGEETDLSIVLADEQTLDEDDEADDAPPVDELDLSDADTADEQADTLALLAELKEKEHDAAMRQYTAEGVRLTADLTSKTKAVKDFQAQSANVLHMRVQYEKRITEMEREMEAVQQERDRVLKELEQSKHAEADKSEYERQYEQAVKKYREQLSTLSSELKATREKLKENERMKRQLAMDEQRIKKLETEIASAKKAKVSLAKKMEESAGKYREWCEMKDNKLKSMVKESRKQSILLKKIESEYAKQSIVLQRRNEEKAVLEKRIKVTAQQQQQQQQQQQHGGGGSGVKAPNSSRSNASSSQQSSHRRSPPTNALRPPRATPARRPAGRRHRESPLARAKAMASNAAALSDSAAPNHPSTASSATSDELLKSAIEHEIATAVERASRGREIEDWKGKLAGLQTQLLAVQDAMMNNPMQTAAQQSEYSHSEQECARIQSSLASMEHSIAMKETELARLMPPSASPLKGSKASTATGLHPSPSSTSKRGQHQEDESVFLSGSDIDYRMFSRIKVLSLDASKRALVYLIHQAVQNDVEKIEMRRELERLHRNADDDRRHGEEKERLIAVRRHEQAVMRSATFTLSPLQQQYDDLPRDSDQQLSPSARQRRISSPTPASPHSPSPATSFTYQPPPVYSPPLTNNFLSADEHNTTFIEIDHSGSATTLATHKPNALAGMGAGAGAVAKKGANVFARLTDTSSFTGMYKSIAEEKRQKMPDIKPKKPIFQQPNKRPFDQLKGGSATQPLSTTTALLSWPPLTTLSHSTSANSLSHSSTATLPTSSASHPPTHSSSPSLHTVDLQGKPAGSVFSRLTNPQLYTGAQRARFMDAQTKAHHRVAGDLDSNGRPTRVASPPRTHSRQASTSDLPMSATYDVMSTPSLPTITDGESVVHVQPLDDSGSADDYHFVEEIRRGISLSLDTGDTDTQQPSDGGDDAGHITPPEELLSPTAPPVFHFSSTHGDDDKENSSHSHTSYNTNSQSNSGDTSPTSKQSFHVHQEGDESADPSRPTHNYNLRSGSQGRISGTQ